MFNIFRKRQVEEITSVPVSAGRVAVFIDGQNTFQAAEEAYESSPFIKALEVAIRKSLGDNETVVRKYFYQHPDSLSESFEGSLLRNVWVVRKTRGDGDAEIIQDVWECSTLVNKVVLVTGDGHFVRTLQYLKSMGKKIVVMAVPNRSCNPILRNSADGFIPITKEMTMSGGDKKPFQQREPKGLALVVG